MTLSYKSKQFCKGSPGRFVYVCKFILKWVVIYFGTEFKPFGFLTLYSAHRTEYRLWLSTAPEADSAASRRSGQAGQGDDSEAGRRLGGGALFDAEVSINIVIYLEIMVINRSNISFRSPGGSTGFNSYSGQLAVSVQDSGAQWVEGNFFKTISANSNSSNPPFPHQMNTNERKAAASVHAATAVVHRHPIHPVADRMVAAVVPRATAMHPIWAYRRRRPVCLTQHQVCVSQVS